MLELLTKLIYNLKAPEGKSYSYVGGNVYLQDDSKLEVLKKE